MSSNPFGFGGSATYANGGDPSGTPREPSRILANIQEATEALAKLGGPPGGFMLITPRGELFVAPTYDELMRLTAHMHSLLRPSPLNHPISF
jgi:hypothetical protein